MTSFSTQKSKGILRQFTNYSIQLSAQETNAKNENRAGRIGTLDFEFKSHGFNACNKVSFVMHKCHYIKGLRFHLSKTIVEARKKI